MPNSVFRCISVFTPTERVDIRAGQDLFRADITLFASAHGRELVAKYKRNVSVKSIKISFVVRRYHST